MTRYQTNAPNARIASNLAGRAAVRAPLTCGEYVQGVLDGVRFLVSCVIADASTALAVIGPCPANWRDRRAIWKSRMAVDRVCAQLGVDPACVSIEVASGFPPGKGFGTSTADIVSSVQAVAVAATGAVLPPEKAAEIACAVEPSDSLMFPGLVAFAHRDGRLLEPLPSPPAITIVAADPGGLVDTLEFNNRDNAAVLRRNAPETERAYELLKQGLHDGSVEGVAAAATLSGRLHQVVSPNSLWTVGEGLYREVGAAGLVLAHSGTLVGFLFESDPEADEARLRLIREAIRSRVTLWVLHAAGGGAQVVGAD